jgi:hypothetical protein
MRPLLGSIEGVLANRRPVASDNIFWQAQQQFAQHIEQTLDACRDVRDHMAEAWFHTLYGAPLLQAMVGLGAYDRSVRRRPGKDPAHAAAVARRIQELRASIAEGGPREALLRALFYIRMPEGLVDERGFNLLRRAREEAGEGLSLGEFKQLAREQFLMLLLDEDHAVEAIPVMLAKDRDLASRMTANLRRMIDAVGLRTSSAKARLAEIDEIIEGSRNARHEKRAVSSVGAAKSHAAAGSKH